MEFADLGLVDLALDKRQKTSFFFVVWLAHTRTYCLSQYICRILAALHYISSSLVHVRKHYMQARVWCIYLLFTSDMSVTQAEDQRYSTYQLMHPIRNQVCHALVILIFSISLVQEPHSPALDLRFGCLGGAGLWYINILPCEWASQEAFIPESETTRTRRGWGETGHWTM